MNDNTWQTKAREIVSQLNLRLSPKQEEVFYADARIKLVGGGEGGSKTFLGTLTALCRSIADAHTYHLNDQLIWVVGADFEDARKEVDYLHGSEHSWLDDLGIMDMSQDSGTIMSSHKDQKTIIKTTIGITFETISAYDVKKIGRDQPDGILGAEVSRWETVEVWKRVKGRLARKFPRAWCYMSGSFETSEGWFPELWNMGLGSNTEDITSLSLPAWANPVTYPGGYDDPAMVMLRTTEDPGRFMERYGGQPSTPRDSVLSEFRHAMHVSEDADYTPGSPVYLFVDPGDRCCAVLFVQYADSEIRVVDEVYVEKWTHEEVINECSLRAAWSDLAPGKHVMDVAGTQHNQADSALEAWRKGTGIAFLNKKHPLDTKIERLRSVLSLNPNTMRPYLQIHPRCRGIIVEMGGGKGPIESMGRWRITRGHPETANDHACSALAYGLLAHFGSQRPNSSSAIRPVSYLPPPAKRGVSYIGMQDEDLLSHVDPFDRTGRKVAYVDIR